MRYLRLLTFSFLCSLSCHAQSAPSVTVETVPALVAISNPKVGLAFVSGRNASNDGGGGLFYYDSSSATTTNLGTIFKPANATGRWIRQYDGPLNVLWFGAYRDGSNATTTTAAIQNAIDTSISTVYTVVQTFGVAQPQAGQMVFLPRGLYSINDTLEIGTSNVQTYSHWFLGEGRFATTLNWTGSGSLPVILVQAPGAVSAPNNILAVTIRDFRILNPQTSAGVGVADVEGIRLIGNVDPVSWGNVGGINQSFIQRVDFANLDNGIHFYGSSNEILIEDCTFGQIYHQLTDVTAALTDALTDKTGNGIIFDGDFVGGGLVTSHQDIKIKGNTFNGIQNRAIDFVRISQAVVNDNVFVGGSFTRTGFLRVRSGNGVYIHGNGTQSTDSANIGSMVDLGTVGLGSSNVSGYTVIGNQFSGAPASASNLINANFADGLFIAGNTLDIAGAGIGLTANSTNVFIGVNNYLGVSTKFTDAGATSLTILDGQLGNVINGTVTLGGDLQTKTAGNGLKIKEGSNARMGIATLDGGSPGTVTVANTSVTANTRILLTSNADGGTPGWVRVSARSAATSFTITSSANGDTSSVAWILLEPSP